MTDPRLAVPGDAAKGLRRDDRWRVAGWCLLLFLVALGCRVAYVRHFGILSQEGGDMGGYIALARNLVAGHGFSVDGLHPSTYRPPLFSWLLALWCRVLGSTSIETMVAWQVVIQSLAAPLTFLLVRELQASRRFSVAAGLFMALYPFPMTGVTLILQEPTQAACAALLGLSVATWWRTTSAWSAAGTGVCLGLCALAKTPFLGAVPIILLIRFGLRQGASPPARQVWLVVGVAAATVLPWTIRNAVVTGGRFVPVNSQDVSVWMVADGGFRWRSSPDDPPQPDFTRYEGVAFGYGNEEGYAYLKAHNEALLDQGLRGEAVGEGLAAASRAYLKDHPMYVLRHVMRGSVMLFVPEVLGPWRNWPVSVRLVAMILFQLPLGLGFAVGLVRALRERESIVLVLALLVAAYLLPHLAVTMEGGRYLSPVVPLLIAIAGYSLFGRGPAWSRGADGLRVAS